MKSEAQTIQLTQQQGILNLYDKYAGMLLGYIFEIVKDHELADQYMVSTFKTIADQYPDVIKAENTWCKLQQLAKVKLADFFTTLHDCETPAVAYTPNAQNKHISLMNNEQRKVFCAIYYQGKTTSHLAKELNKTELHIRKTLKEAFAIIRSNREHTGVH